MSVFEYVAVMMSVVLALVVARILSFVGAVASGKSRFDISWLHFAWVFLIFATLVMAWQTIWNLRDQPAYSLGQVVMMLIATSLIFIAARILIPDEPTEERLDLRDHYFDVRVPFFAVLMVLWLFPLVGMAIFLSFSLFSADVLCRIAWLTLAATGLLVKRTFVHWILACVWFAVLIAYFALVGAEFAGG